MTTQPRFCLNCEEPCPPQPPTDAYLMYFCARCSNGLRPKDRNNVFVGWVRERRKQFPDADVLAGQPDKNWPAGFPAGKPLGQ